jgi:hypothetical protein
VSCPARRRTPLGRIDGPARLEAQNSALGRLRFVAKETTLGLSHPSLFSARASFLGFRDRISFSDFLAEVFIDLRSGAPSRFDHEPGAIV